MGQLHDQPDESDRLVRVLRWLYRWLDSAAFGLLRSIEDLRRRPPRCQWLAFAVVAISLTGLAWMKVGMLTFIVCSVIASFLLSAWLFPHLPLLLASMTVPSAANALVVVWRFSIESIAFMFVFVLVAVIVAWLLGLLAALWLGRKSFKRGVLA